MHKTIPTTTVKAGARGGTKLGLMAAMLSFFGIGQGTRVPRHGKPVAWFKTPQGNRALPSAMQSEVMVCARNKRIRKDELRVAVHHQQKRLGLFK